MKTQQKRRRETKKQQAANLSLALVIAKKSIFSCGHRWIANLRGGKRGGGRGVGEGWGKGDHAIYNT